MSQIIRSINYPLTLLALVCLAQPAADAAQVGNLFADKGWYNRLYSSFAHPRRPVPRSRRSSRALREPTIQAAGSRQQD